MKRPGVAAGRGPVRPGERKNAAGAAASGQAPRPGPFRAWRWIAAALLVLGAAGLLRVGGSGRPPVAREEWMPDLPGSAAYDSAMLLARAGRHEASLPYYRRALHARSDASWALRYNYAVALYNVGVEVRERYGVPAPATRSSIERVGLMRAAMAQLDTAEQIAPTLAERVLIMRSRAERMRIWGMPWDAFMQYRRAQAADPSQPELVEAAERYMLIMREPDR